jgi:hypothetical protein
MPTDVDARYKKIASRCEAIHFFVAVRLSRIRLLAVHQLDRHEAPNSLVEPRPSALLAAAQVPEVPYAFDQGLMLVTLGVLGDDFRPRWRPRRFKLISFIISFTLSLSVWLEAVFVRLLIDILRLIMGLFANHAQARLLCESSIENPSLTTL